MIMMVNSRLSCKEATGNGSEEEGEEQNSPSCARLLLLYRLHECTILAGGPVMPSAPSISRLLPLAPSVFSSALCVAIFCLSSSQLSALIWRRSPANRILFALQQDKHCPCVTPKTFHRPSHLQHRSDIATIGFFLQPKCSEDKMRVKRKKEQLMRRPTRVQVPLPPGAH